MSPDWMLLLKAAVMGVVEGLTEFLPVSSTGHLILAGSLLGFTDEKSKVFDIAIQTGAILAVVMVYAQRLKSVASGLAREPASRRFVWNVLIAFLPAVVLGLLFGKAIKAHLFTPAVVASAFIVGGLIILWAERRHSALLASTQSGEGGGGAGAGLVATVDDLTPAMALKVGLVQCLAMIPGTSRSGATIIGGMFLGLSRQCATDFSFFLAIPTLIGAGGYSLYKSRDLLSWADAPMFGVGLLFSFLSAWLCVRWLLRYVATHNFVPFAWYRIAFGLVVLLTASTGWVNWSA
jgi:undecaprenyl-diphosphatase